MNHTILAVYHPWSSVMARYTHHIYPLPGASNLVGREAPSKPALPPLGALSWALEFKPRPGTNLLGLGVEDGIGFGFRAELSDFVPGLTSSELPVADLPK